MNRRVALDYIPRKLANVRREVVQAHPSTAQAMVDASHTRLEALHDRIRECVADSVALRRLADGLSGRDVRGIARSLGRWDDVRPAAASIVRRRMNRRLLPKLWLTWEEHPGVTDVANLCALAGDRYGWSLIGREGMEAEVARWVGARNPGEIVREWLATQGHTYSDLADLAESPLRPNTPLTRAVRTAVMTHGTSGQLRAEGAEQLLRWLPELNPLRQKGFARHYLVTLRVGEWADAVLRAIESSYGSPRGPRSAFWNLVPQDRRDAFLHWLLRMRLDRAFSGETDRHGYWLSRVSEMIDVETGRAGGTEYAWLVFGDFAVVEFFEVGNAAYFYSRQQARQLRATKPRSPAALKSRETVRFGWSSIPNWLIHGMGWQGQADRYLETWARGTARRGR